MNRQERLSRAVSYLDHGNCKSAFRLLQPLISLRDAEALFWYSTFSLANSETNSEFDSRRLQLLTEASEKGSNAALEALAECYEIGDLVEQSEILAGELYSKAAISKSPYGMFKHGVNLYEGRMGQAENRIEGIALIRHAAELEIQEAIDWVKSNIPDSQHPRNRRRI